MPKTTEITKHLLLIFRRDPTLDTFILLNESGLPISPSSPVLPAQGKNIVVTPMLLVAVTEAMGACREVFGGFEYLMSWTANDYKHFYVILEKKERISMPSFSSGDDQSSPSPWDQESNKDNNDNDNDNDNGGWGNDNNDNNNDTSNDTNGGGGGWSSDNNNNGSNDNGGGWSSENNNYNNPPGNEWTDGPPPSSPVYASNNVEPINDLRNHAWPADLVSLNKPPGRGGSRRAGTVSPGSVWSVRDWARSPSDVGGGTGQGNGQGGGQNGKSAGRSAGGSQSGGGGWMPNSSW